MIILNKPYVSDFLLQTLERLNLPVLDNATVRELLPNGRVCKMNDAQAVERQRALPYPLIYCNSENSLGWVAQNLSFSTLPEKVALFKDKVKFRKLLEPLYPNFFYREVASAELDTLDVNELPMPFIIKPAVGFFSMGVYPVNCAADWPGVLQSIRADMAQLENLYPREVMNSRSFIIEEVIEGEEFAVDAYYNDGCEVVIFDILRHVFASDNDVSDRLYLTSPALMRQYLEPFTALLERIGRLACLRNFPVHVEFRMNSQGACVPIEVNPLRFAGWCTTDIAWYAYGINVYEGYFKQLCPDWDTILASRQDKVYAMVVATLPAGSDHASIQHVDYEKLAAFFKRPLEIRRIDYRQYPVFAFVFAEFEQHEAADRIAGVMNLDFGRFINTL